MNIDATSLVHSWPRSILPEEFLIEMILLRGFLLLHCHLIKSEPVRSRL